MLTKSCIINGELFALQLWIRTLDYFFGHYLTRSEDGVSGWMMEITCLHDHPQAYDLGENEIHTALVVDDFEAALAHHRQMDCICFENAAVGIYFIEDPDGYWVEILPQRRG